MAEEKKDVSLDLRALHSSHVLGVEPDEAELQQAQENEAKKAEDIAPFVDAAGAYDGVYIACLADENAKDGLLEYSGEAGTFTFDPQVFQLKNMQATMPDGSTRDIESLIYIGKETNGAKIQIPEGIRDISGMFAGSNLTSVPAIPGSVERMNMTFMNCKDLQTAKITIPPSVQEMNLTFAGCDHLEKAPAVIPGTVRDCDYCFAGCASLKTTPKFGNGIESMEGVLLDCRNLAKTPSIPKTAKHTQYATANCTKMDEARTLKAQEKLERERAKYREKLDRPKLSSRIGSHISFLMQAHALRKMGYGMIMATIIAQTMRKNNVISKDFKSGFGMMMMNRNPMMGRMVMMNAKTQNEKKAIKVQAKIDAKMAAWDRAHDVYSIGLQEGRSVFDKAQLNGTKDAKNGLFRRMSNMNGTELGLYRQSHGRSAAYEQQEVVLANSGLLAVDAAMAHQTATWYKQQLSDYVRYMKDAQAQIDSMNYTKSERQEALEGLAVMKDVGVTPIVDSMRNLQTQYQLFNDGDVREIDGMMRQMKMDPVFAGHFDAPNYGKDGKVGLRFVDPTKSTPEQVTPSVPDVLHVPKESARLWVPKDGTNPLVAITVPHEASPNGVGSVYVPLHEAKANKDGSYDVSMKGSDYHVKYNGCPAQGDAISPSDFAQRVAAGPVKASGQPSRSSQAEAITPDIDKNIDKGKGNDGPDVV